MCLICVLYDTGKLTVYEARQAIREQLITGTIDIEHARELYESLYIKEN